MYKDNSSKSRSLWLLFVGALFLSSCKVSDPTNVETDDPIELNADWTTESHSNEVDPDYDLIFPQERVNTLEISMTAADWAAIQADMVAKSYGSFGVSGGGVGGPGGGGGVDDFGDDPEYIETTVKYNGKAWTHVGFRLKGNSSLSSIWKAGIYKLPFRLHFDKFEDDYPALKNQRMYGFKELSMSPGFSDNSLLREKVVADIFRSAGVQAARTAFYKVYIDFGTGSKYCGVYTMVEVIDDTMVEDQFGEDDGNIYKPESYLKTFTQLEFDKKNNEDEADYNDVKSFITALNSTIRTTDAAQWRTNLESTFDVDHFLKYLAVNNTISSWDVYGSKAHNYYLYNSPTDHLKWIPWDHNMAFTLTTSSTVTGPGGNGPGGNAGGGGMTPVSLSMSEVTSTWPLLRYVADDPIYYAKYKEYVKSFKEEIFIPGQINATLQKYHDLIQPYVTGSEPEQTKYSNLTNASSFDTELTNLKNHVISRNAAVETFLK
ncbi:CotH kinase family protein [Dyadobacter tibetensis]|uniref:CotH kinase family protein n=1 Tax=Dyadobacter tibetensis TaxID=1211851 RepID=UPI0004709994|nr:CotH kinase family protein [Dyadobacter tibetensis]